VGGAAELHNGGVTRESPKWQFGGRGLTERGLGGGGDDGEAEGRLATMRRGWWHLVPVEGNG
jgi:hypothetical protein